MSSKECTCGSNEGFDGRHSINCELGKYGFKSTPVQADKPIGGKVDWDLLLKAVGPPPKDWEPKIPFGDPRAKEKKPLNQEDLEERVESHVKNWVLENEVMPSSSEIQFLVKEIKEIFTERETAARKDELERLKIQIRAKIKYSNLPNSLIEDRLKELDE